MYTVRLCRDRTGWFATWSDEFRDYPGVCTHWEESFRSPDDAMRGLDLAQALASRLESESGLWTPQAAARALPAEPLLRPEAASFSVAQASPSAS